MMTVVWWFLFERWQFKSWTKVNSPEDNETLLSNAFRCNVASCRTHLVIYRDMQRILLK